MTTATELLDLLALSLAPPKTGHKKRRRGWWQGGLFVREIEAPQQYRIGPRGGRYPLPARRADAVWVPHNKDGLIYGYEVKVSRADLVHELADPTKATAWKQYCDYWWLVVPGPGLIEGLEIPGDWGVLGPPSGNRVKAMTVYRKAPKLEPIDKTPALARLATSSAWRHRQTEVLLENAQARIEELEAQVADLQLDLEIAA